MSDLQFTEFSKVLMKLWPSIVLIEVRVCPFLFSPVKETNKLQRMQLEDRSDHLAVNLLIFHCNALSRRP